MSQTIQVDGADLIRKWQEKRKDLDSLISKKEEFIAKVSSAATKPVTEEKAQKLANLYKGISNSLNWSSFFTQSVRDEDSIVNELALNMNERASNILDEISNIEQQAASVIDNLIENIENSFYGSYRTVDSLTKNKYLNSLSMHRKQLDESAQQYFLLHKYLSQNEGFQSYDGAVLNYARLSLNIKKITCQLLKYESTGLDSISKNELGRLSHEIDKLFEQFSGLVRKYKPKKWFSKERPFDFFEVKERLENLRSLYGYFNDNYSSLNCTKNSMLQSSQSLEEILKQLNELDPSNFVGSVKELVDMENKLQSYPSYEQKLTVNEFSRVFYSTNLEKYNRLLGQTKRLIQDKRQTFTNLLRTHLADYTNRLSKAPEDIDNYLSSYQNLASLLEDIKNSFSCLNLKADRTKAEDFIKKAKSYIGKIQSDFVEQYLRRVNELRKKINSIQDLTKSEHIAYSSTISDIQQEINNSKQQNKLSIADAQNLQDKISALHEILTVKEKNQADRFNNKYPISDNIVYHARDGRKWDVRDFIQADNAILKQAVEQHQLKGKTLDEIAYKCMLWVQKNIKYVSDPQQSAYPEEWLFPTETYQTKKGDCEDGTNLMISLMRNAGMPSYRIKNACGLVGTENGEGGHSWPIYLRETDNEWVILDWSYKPTKKPIEKRELAKNRTDYKEIWFTFNDGHSWAQKSIDVNGNYLKDLGNVVEEPVSGQKVHLGNFSLPLYIETIEFPRNTDYFRLRHILQGDFEDGWIDRFQHFSDYLDKIPLAENQRDIDYVKKVRYGILKTLQEEPIKRDIEDSKQGIVVVKGMLNKLDSYITKSTDCTPKLVGIN